jgi:hypothetical protein
VIIPTCCYEELKNISQKKATLWEFQKKEMCAEFTGMNQHNVELNQALRLHLNRNLSGTVNEVQDKISWVFDKELGICEDWQAFRVHQVAVRMVARLVAGVFVGPRFAKDDEWTDLSLRLATELVYARDAIKRWPTWIQPLVGHFLPEIRNTNRQITRMAEMLKPVINESVLQNPVAQRPVYDEEKIDLAAEDGKSEGTFMSWVVDRLDTTDPEAIARVQLSCEYIPNRLMWKAADFP